VTVLAARCEGREQAEPLRFDPERHVELAAVDETVRTFAHLGDGGCRSRQNVAPHATQAQLGFIPAVGRATSYAERANRTMRRYMRRFTRLTNAFSKKVDNHKAAPALHFVLYNFARIHKTLRVTPAMEAGKADHVGSLEEIAGPAG